MTQLNLTYCGWTRSGVALVLLILATWACAEPATRPAAASDAPRARYGKLRMLKGDEWGRACDARDLADRLRGAFESHHRAGRDAAKNANDADAEFAQVVQAFQSASTRFPATEIDCYCRLRLAGAYQYRGDFERALKEAKEAAELFAGTKMAQQAELSVGLIYLNGLHKPDEARAWFERVRGEPVSDDAQEQAKWQAAASEALAQCDVEAARLEKQKKQPGGR